MKDYLAAIIARIKEGAYYHGLSQKCPVDSAVEVEAITDKEDLELARDEFFAAYGLTSQVWARIPKRFPNFRNTNSSGTRALAYMCQLPLAECQDLYIEMADMLDDPNAHDLARRRVNEIKEAKKQQRKPRAAKSALAELVDLLKEVKAFLEESEMDYWVKNGVRTDMPLYAKVCAALAAREAKREKV